MREALPELVRVNLQIGQLQAMDSTGCIGTKSYLTAADIETRISSVTLGIFEADGTQAYLEYLTAGFGSIDVALRTDRIYNVYALANMGDQRTNLAAAVTNGTIPSMTYTVDYASMASAGIPMAGQTNVLAFAEGQGVTLSLERLLARVDVSLSCGWSGAVITSATVKNVNPTVAPFGTVPASSTNAPTLQDIHGTVAGTAASLSAVFYVPENTQGTVGSISSSWQKTYSNYALSSIRDYATYLETLVSTTGQYTGTVVYRSYLGANQTTDFNILRNQVYQWSITYHEENLMDYDWKRAADVSVPASIRIYPWQFDGADTDYVGYGSRASVTATYSNTGPVSGFTSYATNLRNCTSSDFTYGNDGATVWVYWNSANPSSTVRRVNIYLRDPGSGAEDFLRCSQDGHTAIVTHCLVISGATSADVGDTVPLTATYYTLTDGISDGGTDVTQDSNCTWECSGVGSVNNTTGPDKGKVTSSMPGTAHVRASYEGASDTHDVEFNPAVTPPTELYKVVTTLSPTELYVGDTASATAALYVSTDDGATWTYQSDVTGSGFGTIAGGSHVSIWGNSVTGVSYGSVTLRSQYSADFYEDAELNVWDSYQMEISGTTTAVRTSSIILTGTLKKNGSPVSASFDYSWLSVGDYVTVSRSGNVFTIASDYSCQWHDMSHYTIRFQVNTDAHTGTLFQEVDIVFEPTSWSITIGLRYESGSSFTTSSCTYYAEASEIVPPEAQYIPLTAIDNYGNHWAFDSIDHTMVTAAQVNPGGFNPYGNPDLAMSLHIVSITPSTLFSRSWDANYTFLAGPTQPN